MPIDSVTSAVTLAVTLFRLPFLSELRGIGIECLTYILEIHWKVFKNKVITFSCSDKSLFCSLPLSPFRLEYFVGPFDYDRNTRSKVNKIKDREREGERERGKKKEGKQTVKVKDVISNRSV